MIGKWSAVLIGASALSVATPSLHAISIAGSLGLAGINVTQNGADLSVSTLINAGGTVSTSVGVGNYSPIPLLTDFGSTTLDLTLVGSGFGYSFSHPSYGTFTASSGVIVSQSANFLDLFILGSFSPGPSLAPADESTDTSLRISINQSGASISQAITLNTPPVPPPPGVPDSASTFTLCALGLGAAAAARRFRR